MTIFQFLMLYGLKLEIEPFMTRFIASDVRLASLNKSVPLPLPFLPLHEEESTINIWINRVLLATITIRL